MFLRKAKRRDPVPVTMIGVRMGERLLQIGIDDPSLIGALAAKAGLSGSATSVVDDEASAANVRAQAADAGVLIEVHVAQTGPLPLPDDAFDIVVVHSARGRLAGLDPMQRTATAREYHRVVRRGGRVVVIDPGTRHGISAIVRGGGTEDPAYAAAGGTVAVLESGGFKPVRQVGDVEGFRFTEGLKS